MQYLINIIYSIFSLLSVTFFFVLKNCNFNIKDRRPAVQLIWLIESID